MNSILLKRLFTVYIKQLFFVGIVLSSLSIILFIWMFNTLDEIELKQKFGATGMTKFLQEASIDEYGELVASQAMLERLKEDGGWIQSIDDHGVVLQSFFVPGDVPSFYPPALLIDYWYQIKPFPYALLLYTQLKDDKRFTLIYGKAPQQIQTFSHYFKHMTLVDNTIDVSAMSEQELLEVNAWVQVLDEQQREIASWNKPTPATDSFTLQTLLMSSSYSMHNGIAIDTYYDEITGYSWLIHFPVAKDLHTFSMLPTLEPELELLLIGILILLILSFIALILLAIMYANRFMKPIAHIITQITRLGHGVELGDASKTTKRSKKLFSEVYDSIAMVNDRLIDSARLEQETQQRRDEWIAGISHDIKTPLSTIKGYAHMLSTEKYDWSSDEIRGFAEVMLEKSNYMNQLLEDLSLTYMLSNNTLPVTLTEHSINDVLADAIDHIVNGEAIPKDTVSLELPNDVVKAPIHPPWLERIMYNLVINALSHNTDGTKVSIQLHHNASGWTIIVQDNGKGMDKETMALLFERYYRGTNTEQQSNGTGLGMAITKQLVQAMGGSINVVSQPSIGTTISLVWVWDK